MNKATKILNFQEYRTKLWEIYTLKKADPETFSVWVACMIFLHKCKPCLIFVDWCNIRKIVIKVIG